MLHRAPVCLHSCPVASLRTSRPLLGAHRPCVPLLPQAPCRVAGRPGAQRLTVHAVKGKVAKDSLIDGRTVPKDLPEASAKQVKTRGSVHKYRRALDTIRGRKYNEALIFMSYLPYRACEKLVVLLKSAAANAKDKYGLEEKDLYVSECYADQAGYLRRAQPRAKGRAYKIQKPWSHMTIKVKQFKDDKPQDTTLALPDAQQA